MSDTFGARVRQHREQRGISLAEIAERTKIKASMLEGLERDDVSQWPAGIFRRAYVRAYANAVGLDPDPVVSEFLQMHPEPVQVVEPEPPKGGRLRELVGSAFGSLSRRRATAPAAPAAAPDQPVTAGTSGKAAAPAVLVERPAGRPSIPAAASSGPDLLAAASICTELGRVQNSGQLAPLLREAARVLAARGVILWVWDALADELKPAVVHGYAANVRSQLRGVRPDADNLTAAAFRSGETRTLSGSNGATSAFAVPLLTSTACAGVLAIELPRGSEHASVLAIATFLAAMLAQLVGGTPQACEPEFSSELEAEARAQA